MGCAGVTSVPSRANNETPPEALKKPWKHAMETCHVDPVAVTVVCPAEDFSKVMKSCVSLWERLGKTENRLTEAIKLGLVDKQVLEAQVYELTMKLQSPWRSWWLWLIIGSAAGAAATTGIVLGTR